MKKVIFVCLLTLSVCLSDPVTTAATTKPGEAPSTTTNKTEQVTSTSAPAQNPAGHNNETKPTSPTTAATANVSTPHTPVTVAPNATTETSGGTNNTTSSTTTTTTIKPSEHNATTTTEKVTTSTALPAATTVKPLQARGFDGASFVGGIILTLGLLAIGFMGFKYYKAQTERNYHTL